MNNATAQAPEAYGLDVGTSRVVSARRQGKEFQFETQLNAFVTIPFSKMTQSILEKESIPHLLHESEILVYGDESERFANLFHRETRRPMLSGVLNPQENQGLTLVREIVKLLTTDHGGGRQKLCFSVPAAPLGAKDTVQAHEAEMKEMLSNLGFEVSSISEGLAVVYGEMANSNYTGIGISCAAGYATCASPTYRCRSSASAFQRPATSSIRAWRRCGRSRPRAYGPSRRSLSISMAHSPMGSTRA